MSRDPAITLSLPLSALPAVTVAAPPPALVGPKVNPEHLGLDEAACWDVFRAMRSDPAWASKVIVLSQKRVLAAPEDVIAFMRDRYGAGKASVETVPQNEDPAEQGDLAAMLERHGFTEAPANTVSRRAAGGRRR